MSLRVHDPVLDPLAGGIPRASQTELTHNLLLLALFYFHVMVFFFSVQGEFVGTDRELVYSRLLG